MNAEDAPAFVDTNIFVYVQEAVPSAKQSVASQLIARLVLEHRLRISTQVLQELFHTLTRKSKERLSVEEGLAYLDDLSRWDPVLVTSRSSAGPRPSQGRFPSPSGTP